MSQYTEEDKEAFRKKDILNARMSALKAVASNHEGKEFGDIQFRSEADLYFKWLTQDQDWSNGKEISGGSNSNVNSGNIVCPTPTKVQLEWLKKIEDKYNFTKEQVWAKCGKYPGNKDESVEVVKTMKG